MQDFISSEITRSILEQTLMIFGSVKEGILEILDERLGSFCAEAFATLALTLFLSARFVLVELPCFLERRSLLSVGDG